MHSQITRVRRRAAMLCVLSVVGVVSLSAGGAQAATVHVGSPLTGDFGPIPYAGDVLTLVQRTLPEPGANVASPVDGTVVSYQLADADGAFAIQVVRFSGTAAQSVASSTPTATIASGISPPIATSLPIKAGDYIGVKNTSGSDALGAIANNSIYSLWSTPLADDATPRDPDSTTDPFEIGIGATVRYCRVPKLKGKSPKAARKALANADCKVGKVKKTKTVRNKKRVLSQSAKPGTAISDTAPVNLKVSRVG